MTPYILLVVHSEILNNLLSVAWKRTMLISRRHRDVIISLTKQSEPLEKFVKTSSLMLKL